MNINTSGDDNCVCHHCIKEKNLTDGTLFGIPLPLNATMMIVCDECGNKRCPKASDHRYLCTNSNEPNQEGSIY